MTFVTVLSPLASLLWFFFIRLPLELFMSAHVGANKEVSQFSAAVKLLVTDALNLNRPPSQKFCLHIVFTPANVTQSDARVCFSSAQVLLIASACARTAGRACARLKPCVFSVPRTGTR